MKITLFSKKKHTKEGKEFNVFVGTLNRKDGTNQYMTVKYSGDDKRLDFDGRKCPYIIEFNKEDANITKKTRTLTDKETGETKSITNYTLWLKNYKESSEKFIDHSLDEFE